MSPPTSSQAEAPSLDTRESPPRSEALSFIDEFRQKAASGSPSATMTEEQGIDWVEEDAGPIHVHRDRGFGNHRGKEVVWQEVDEGTKQSMAEKKAKFEDQALSIARQIVEERSVREDAVRKDVTSAPSEKTSPRPTSSNPETSDRAEFGQFEKDKFGQKVTEFDDVDFDDRRAGFGQFEKGKFGPKAAEFDDVDFDDRRAGSTEHVLEVFWDQR